MKYGSIRKELLSRQDVRLKSQEVSKKGRTERRPINDQIVSNIIKKKVNTNVHSRKKNYILHT